MNQPNARETDKAPQGSAVVAAFTKYLSKRQRSLTFLDVEQVHRKMLSQGLPSNPDDIRLIFRALEDAGIGTVVVSELSKQIKRIELKKGYNTLNLAEAIRKEIGVITLKRRLYVVKPRQADAFLSLAYMDKVATYERPADMPQDMREIVAAFFLGKEM